MTDEPEQPSLFEDSLWGEAFGDLANAQPVTPIEPVPDPADEAVPPLAEAEPAVHPDQPSLYEPTQPDLRVQGPHSPAAVPDANWSRTGTPGRAAPTAPRSVLTTHLEPTQELPRTPADRAAVSLDPAQRTSTTHAPDTSTSGSAPDNVVPLRPPAAAQPMSTPGAGAATSRDVTSQAEASVPTPGAPAADAPAGHVRWAAVVMFLGEVAWVVLIAMIGWRLGSGWPIGAATAGVLVCTFGAVWAMWLAPRANHRLVAEDRSVVLMLIGSLITVLGAWVGLLAPTLVASLVVIAAHTLDHKLAIRRASRLSDDD